MARTRKTPKERYIEKNSPPGEQRMLEYKVVECSTVTDDQLEAIINDFVRRGWHYDGMQFAMRESSKRPAMAFILFTRQNDHGGKGSGGARGGC